MTKLIAKTLALIAALTLAGFIGYRNGQQNERAYTLGCEPGLISGPCVEDARRALIAEFADCTIADAHADRCFIPCATDADCMEKNGMRDH